ncbi:MAG: GIY-YIG nuclease family protein [Clostridiales bacterium]|nr:GIY-YIG nuclease family protein [Clostridiales bacterium]
MIKLVDILNIKSEDYKNYKIHFATGALDKSEPYNEFLIDGFGEWQSYQTRKNFNRNYVISLIYYSKDVWMFGGVYKVNSKEPKSILRKNGKEIWQYDLSLTDNQEDLIGRVFVSYRKEFRNSYPCLEFQSGNGEAIADICVSSILDKRMTINDFNGFDNVNIEYQTLKYIIDNNIATWKSALSNVKGIYLIVDTLTGKQYVGSAYGDDCIWQRWSEYAKCGHGGNIELKEILHNKGVDYRNNFKYSILEVCNMNLGNDYIIGRETYWKEVLMTRKFGMNRN